MEGVAFGEDESFMWRPPDDEGGERNIGGRTGTGV